MKKRIFSGFAGMLFLILFINLSIVYAIDTKGYYGGEEKVSALISASELYQWVKNGGRTEDGRKVVIIDIIAEESLQEFFEGDAEALADFGMKWAPFADKAGYFGHIPGAQMFISHLPGHGHISTRNDGPMDVTHQLGDEKTMNRFLQEQGIDINSVVVLTTSDFTRAPYCQSRAFWTLRYWGMSIKNLRILDGGNVSWAQYIAKEHPAQKAQLGLQKGEQSVKVMKSTLKVTDFPKKFIRYRAAVGEVIKAVDEGKLADESMYVLDVRPPSAFFIKNMDNVKDNLKGSKLAVPAGNSGFPGFDANEFSPVNVENSDFGAFKSDKGQLPITVAAKPVAFDAQVRGALLGKGKSRKGELYDITPGVIYNMGFIKDDNGKPLFNFFTTYKKATEPATMAKWVGDSKPTVEQMFARIFPDRKKEIIVNCNTGSAASIHWFYLSEVLKYENVKNYDGSAGEWGNLTAFEPNDENVKAGLHVVRPDVYTWTPKPPLEMPAVTVFASGEPHPFQIVKGNDGKFVALDEVTGEKCVIDADNCWLKTGGALKGDLKWDTVSRSQHIFFRPTGKVNDGVFAGKDNPLKKQEYNKNTDWPTVKVHPDYKGAAVETIMMDESCK